MHAFNILLSFCQIFLYLTEPYIQFLKYFLQKFFTLKIVFLLCHDIYSPVFYTAGTAHFSKCAVLPVFMQS